jgi:hypothetical protein
MISGRQPVGTYNVDGQSASTLLDSENVPPECDPPNDEEPELPIRLEPPTEIPLEPPFMRELVDEPPEASVELPALPP